MNDAKGCGGFTMRLRLEDAVALAFFLLGLAMKLFFRGLRQEQVDPTDVLIILPAVSLLLLKELIHYFFSSKASARSGLRSFLRPYWEILRDWFPFLLILMMYYSLWGDATHLMVTTDRDAALIAADQRLFGFQASVALQRFISPPLTAWMDFAYTFHLWNIPLVACLIYALRPRPRFREMMVGMLVITFIGLCGYLLVPAIGPMYTLAGRYTVPLHGSSDLFSRSVHFMDFARISRDCFPSLHVGISFVVWLYAWRNFRWLGTVLTPLILSLWISTVYLRFHYLVDCVAGLVLAPLSFLAANWLFARFGEIRIAIPLAGTGARGRVLSREPDRRNGTELPKTDLLIP